MNSSNAYGLMFDPERSNKTAAAASNDSFSPSFDFEEVAVFVCKDGRRARQNYDQVEQLAVCKEGNVWEIVNGTTWDHCLESTYVFHVALVLLKQNLIG